jgi:hypothetical protein
MVSVYGFQVQCEECSKIAQPDRPKNRLKWILGMAVVFAGIGFAIGSVAGVASAGVGFVAWVFTVPIGIYMGYKIGSFGAELMDGPSCPACNASHDSGGLLPF